jgi:hypothetical protein
MGSKVQKQAIQLGFNKFRLVQLYGRPRRIRRTFSKAIPDIVDAIRDNIAMQDAAVTIDKSGGGRNFSFYLLSQKAQIYTEVIIKMAGFAAVDPSNYAMQINIYTNNDQIVRGIANVINTLYEDGMLAHLEFDKFEKKYQVKQEAVIAEWKKWL